MLLIEITIPNWQKYNPRSDRANYSWFRFQNGFFEDPLVTALSAAQKMLLVYCLCEASKVNTSGRFTINTELAAFWMKMKVPEIVENLDWMAKLGLLKAEERRLNDGLKPAQLPATNVTNVTERTNELLLSRPSRFDFDSVYKGYPRKVGKEAGVKRLKSQIKTAEEFSLLCDALKNYVAHIKREGTEPKYIMHFSTWVGKWRDWSDPETGSVDGVEKKQTLEEALREVEAELNQECVE